MLLGLAEGAIQLVPDGTLVFHVAAIIAMVAVLNATLLRPINRILEERERRTKGKLNEAQKTLLLVEQKLRDYEQRLRAARAEGYALMEHERLIAAAKRERAVDSVKAEITHRLSEEKETIKLEAANVRERLKDDARNMAMEISRQILHRPITGQISTT
ncbi:MAG: ATP synthase F0 subunit B [Acidobacteriota bacterium]|nr:ATP synthase F0 subunit B [Acidobacteriota bacterium]